ncbi:HNH endonuclease [Pseudomonas folii]|uniref:HNH endonuclease n=1 Tax=Pseudomonas folii TaxID=2762593 RepID=A0ABR7ATU2_9PSED|nr:HNH endonuclease [Pseudomonas folii]MBC3948337.1 HNH endonuclease [Pseudomonas folii]
MVTAETVKEALRYSPVVGVFEWRKAGRRVRVGGLAGAVVKSTGYVRIVLAGKPYPAHRLAWLYMTGEWPAQDIDHIDGDRSNNAWNNLREANANTNGWNKKVLKTNKAGIKGLTQHKETGRWQARFEANSVVWSAMFATKSEAEKEMRAKREEIHGEFANHGQHRFEQEENKD